MCFFHLRTWFETHSLCVAANVCTTWKLGFLFTSLRALVYLNLRVYGWMVESDSDRSGLIAWNLSDLQEPTTRCVMWWCICIPFMILQYIWNNMIYSTQIYSITCSGYLALFYYIYLIVYITFSSFAASKSEERWDRNNPTAIWAAEKQPGCRWVWWWRSFPRKKYDASINP